MIRFILGVYLVGMGFYAITNPTKLMQLAKQSNMVKDNNVVGVMLGGVGSVIIGLSLFIWLLL